MMSINTGPSPQQVLEITALYKEGKYRESLAIAEKLALQFPYVPITAYLLGASHVALGNPDKAADGFKKAIRLQPEFAEAHNDLGDVLRSQGKAAEALESYRNAVRIKPEYFVAHNSLGVVLNDLGRPDDAISSLSDALRLQPDLAEAHCNMGNALHALGRQADARSSYEQALTIDPGFAVAHRCLSAVKDYGETDPQFEQMLELNAQPDLPDGDRMHLAFALAKAHEDIGEYDAAFSYYVEGNNLRRMELKYAVSEVESSFEKIKATFSEHIPVFKFDDASGDGNDCRPVFIVGMPRSGTTLVEQILASHSRIHGAGELNILGQAIDAITWPATELTAGQLLTVRDEYLKELQRIDLNEPFVTDKMPVNFYWIGFITSVLPEAKIVHVKRDARATCWSVFKQYFSEEESGFSCDLNDVADYYKLYADLMAFWHRMNPGLIYDLQYESLTENPEAETRKLLEFVGLDWEEQCLSFHETERPVQTASAAQVRKELYQGSSGDWRHYEKHLNTLVASLNGY